jgi:hypothetical protein
MKSYWEFINESEEGLRTTQSVMSKFGMMDELDVRGNWLLVQIYYDDQDFENFTTFNTLRDLVENIDSYTGDGFDEILDGLKDNGYYGEFSQEIFYAFEVGDGTIIKSGDVEETGKLGTYKELYFYSKAFVEWSNRDSGAIENWEIAIFENISQEYEEREEESDEGGSEWMTYHKGKLIWK